MTHDIVVKQVVEIDIDIEPGTFTEFIITLPHCPARGTGVGKKSE